MTNFIWPSDQDRANNDGLNRVCEYLDEVLEELKARRVQVMRQAAALQASAEREQTLKDALEEERQADEDVRDILDRVKAERTGLAAQVEHLKSVLQLAKNNHGASLMSDPPQDAWKYHKVDEVIANALSNGSQNLLTVRDLTNQAEGMRKAALLIEQKADAYNAEHGTTDPETGHREYPGDGAEHYNELMELADELRQKAQGEEPCD